MAGRLSGEIKKGAKVSMLQSKLSIGGKEQTVYKIDLVGFKGIKLDIGRVTSFYFYKNNKLMSFKLK